MTKELVINYRGHEIKWSENMEEWTCYDLSGKVKSAEKPSKIKAAIDKMYLDRRKASAIPVLEITYGGGGTRSELIDAKVTEYVKCIKSSSWSSKPPPDRHVVAVSALRSGNDRPTRLEKEITELAIDTPEVRDAYAAYLDAYTTSQQWLKKANELREAIPRLTLDDIKPMVELYEQMKDEGA